VRLFPEEGSAEGCASGECLPEAAAAAVPEPRATRDQPELTTAERWRAALESVKRHSVRHGASLAFGRVLWLRPGEVGLAYPPTAGFHRTTVSTGTGKATVEKALSEHFGRPTRLSVEVSSAGDAANQTLSVAEEEQQTRVAHEKTTEGRVRTHPAVRATLKLLGGELEHIQVYEPSRAAAPDDTAEETS